MNEIGLPWHFATMTPSTLPDLPLELIFHIASLLEVRDLVALRRVRSRSESSNRLKLTRQAQCQRFLYDVTRDKLLWRRILRDFRRPPLPRALRSRCLENLSYPELEEAVSISYVAEHRWLKQRGPGSTLFAGGWGRISLLTVLDDRWVVVIPERGTPAIWDIRDDPPKPRNLSKSMLNVFEGRVLEAIATVDPSQGNIFIGLRK